MVRALQTKLPRSYFKRVRPENPPVIRDSKPTSSSMFILGGKGTLAATGRQAFWANTFAKDIRNISRLTHAEQTAVRWRSYYQDGRLGGDGEPVAVIVDGAAQRKISNVKVFGQIAIVESPRGNKAVVEAVALAITAWQAASPRLSGDYVNNIIVFADNQIAIDPGQFLSETGRESLVELANQTEKEPFYTIVNTMPYAAKVERDNLPSGVAYHAWKAARSASGNEVSVRFRYYTADTLPISGHQYAANPGKRVTVTKGGGRDRRSHLGKNQRRDENYAKAGKPLSFPAVNIGPPGAFNSGATRVITGASSRAKRG